MSDNPYILAEQFALNTNRCIFITGKAGTGKTTLLKKLKEISYKNMAVVAPTGVAAINAGGMTIHSLFQLPIRPIAPTSESYYQLFAEQRMQQSKRNMLYHLEVLVIDEISMVRADVLDAVDAVLRHYKYKPSIPFGGVQVIMFGDLMQLSPVVQSETNNILSKYYEGPYFFNSIVMRQVKPIFIELNNIFRQKDEKFLTILNQVRDNNLTSDSKRLLESRYIPNFINKDSDFHITLTTHNQQADTINQNNLNKLSSRIYVYKAEISDNFPESSFPTDKELQLKVGARVMFIHNDSQNPRRFYNGKEGIITNIDKKKVEVTCDDGVIEVEPITWKNVKYVEDNNSGKIKEEILGSFKQLPLRLAWAITIHKSQGLTFDKIIIDAAYAFAYGQVYVALSRCTTLEGIVLSSSLKNVSLQNDQNVINFINNQQSKDNINDEYSQAKKEYEYYIFSELFSLIRLLSLSEQLKKNVAKYISFNKETDLFLDKLSNRFYQLLPITDKFKLQLKKIIISNNTDILQQRIKAAANYFLPILNDISSDVLNHPCKCKNKSDSSDFDVLMSDMYLTLQQKIAMMLVTQQTFTIYDLLTAKKDFNLENIKLPSAYGKKVKSKISSTFEQSYELYINGNTIEQIAQKRSLNYETVFSHIFRYVESGQILLCSLVPQNIINRIIFIRVRHKDFTTLKEFFEEMNGEIPYVYIRAVLSYYKLL